MSSSSIGTGQQGSVQNYSLQQTQGTSGNSKPNGAQSDSLADISSLFSQLLKASDSDSASSDAQGSSDDTSATSLLEALKQHHHKHAGNSLLQSIEQALNAQESSSSDANATAAATASTAAT